MQKKQLATRIHKLVAKIGVSLQLLFFPLRIEQLGIKLNRKQLEALKTEQVYWGGRSVKKIIRYPYITVSYQTHQLSSYLPYQNTYLLNLLFYTLGIGTHYT